MTEKNTQKSYYKTLHGHCAIQSKYPNQGMKFIICKLILGRGRGLLGDDWGHKFVVIQEFYVGVHQGFHEVESCTFQAFLVKAFTCKWARFVLQYMLYLESDWFSFSSVGVILQHFWGLRILYLRYSLHKIPLITFMCQCCITQSCVFLSISINSIFVLRYWPHFRPFINTSLAVRRVGTTYLCMYHLSVCVPLICVCVYHCLSRSGWKGISEMCTICDMEKVT